MSAPLIKETTMLEDGAESPEESVQRPLYSVVASQAAGAGSKRQPVPQIVD